MLGGFKFAIQGGLRPVYRRPRFDYGESLLSGPAWAGVLAVLFARRNALRAWLGEGAARYAVVGVLAAGLGVQASTTPSAAQSAAKGPAAASHSAAAKPATASPGLAAGVLALSEADGDHRTDAGNVPATAVPLRSTAGGGQGRGLSVPDVGAATALGDQIDLLGAIGLFDLSGAGSNASSERAGNDGSGPGSKPTANSSQPGSASDSPASGSFASGSSGSPTDDPLTDAGGVFVWWPAGLPTAVLAQGAGSGSIDIASGLGTDGAPRSTRVFDDSYGQEQGGGGSADVGAPTASGAVPVSSDVPGPDAVPEAFRVPGLVSGGSGGLGGVPEVFRVPGLVSGRSLGVGGVPEPATWVTMLVGLFLVGRSARQRRAQA